MASIIDCFQESINENMALVKIAAFSVPVYICIKLFMVGKMTAFTTLTVIFGALMLGVMTQGINNIRLNKSDIMTLNPLKIGFALLKALVVLVPQGLVFGFIGHFCVMFLTSIPVQIEHYNLIIMIIVWSIIGSILLTSYLSFAKYLRIPEGYNFAVISESCVDVFLSVLFFFPQVLFVNLFVFGPIYYLFRQFNIPFEHWGFIAFASVAIVINFSMFTNYLAQASYEQIKGNNEDYDDNYNKIDMIEDSAQRMNGR